MSVDASVPALEIEDLTLRMGTRTLIRNFSLRIFAGQVWCILGCNGIGKTTLLHALVGLHGVARGVIRLSGRPLEKWSAGDAAGVRALLPQTFHDAFGVTVQEIVLMGRHPYLSRWGWESGSDHELARVALRAVGLEELAARDVMTLSGGERQRVAIAAVLAQDSMLMLLDEPVAHLDMHHQIVVLRHLASLAQKQGKAIVLSIHDLNLAHRFATHAMIFRPDAGVSQGPIDDVMSEATLTTAFGYPVAKARVGQRTVFIPA